MIILPLITFRRMKFFAVEKYLSDYIQTWLPTIIKNHSYLLSLIIELLIYWFNWRSFDISYTVKLIFTSIKFRELVNIVKNKLIFCYLSGKRTFWRFQNFLNFENRIIINKVMVEKRQICIPAIGFKITFVNNAKITA